ncbi:transferase [Gordonia sp. CNJ-863]|uniref:class I SAM-dependent methyltransferase n=1 Tax=Gordonia sp. CNJ-863 TaxID=1904963 RepID=UPI0009697B2C|nr:class I SAM-dependent methyltransferase [Gordonia sp. CNJ-863]OLT48642.1 transferase [Gordonia sp. CNJ-863]
MTHACRGCRSGGLTTVLDLGRQPAGDRFPLVDEPITSAESGHPLAMNLCPRCGLAQLAADDTNVQEPRGVEPQALREQAADAVARIATAGLLPAGGTVREFPSPHGGSWLPLLTQRGYEVTEGPADVVVDSMGIMHEPDQRAAFTERARALRPDGLLLVQFHSLATILRHRQWNALRHGHFAYYSLTSLTNLLSHAGLVAVGGWEFDLYGGSVLVAARHAGGALPTGRPFATLAAIADAERAAGVTDVESLRALDDASERGTRILSRWARRQAAQGNAVYAYGASSRAVSLFARAGLTREVLRGVADAAPAKHGRRMPGTDIPIIAPEVLVRVDPDAVLLTVPDLYDEVCRSYPQLATALKSAARDLTRMETADA